MKKLKYFALICLLLSVITAKAQTPVNPYVKDYGTINSIPGVTATDTKIDYKIVIDLKSSNDDYASVNRGLNNVARLLNLHGAAGIPVEKLHVAVAVHYTATPIILNNEGYQKKYGVDNPNLELISQLKSAGVEVYVCGQSLVARKYDFKDVNPEVQVGLSMLTVVSEKMMKGYELLVFE